MAHHRKQIDEYFKNDEISVCPFLKEMMTCKQLKIFLSCLSFYKRPDGLPQQELLDLEAGENIEELGEDEEEDEKEVPDVPPQA